MLYALVKCLFRLVFGLAGLEVAGVDRIPREGPCIIAGNHVGFWDPFLIWTALNRRGHYMAKAELFRYKVFVPILKYAGAFAVRRGSSDRHALQMALDLLKQEQVVVMFVPGTRVSEETRPALKPGVAMLAVHSSAPVVPVALTGSDRVFSLKRKSRPRVVFGEPMTFSEMASSGRHQRYEAITSAIWERIDSLLPKGKELATAKRDAS